MAVPGLLFASGYTSLLYEVLWLRSLRTLFGGGAHATAVTLAVFFAGLAAGSLLFGRSASRSRRPLRLYAALEIGIAVTGGLSFFLPRIDGGLSSALAARWVEGHGALPLRMIATTGLLVPTAILMGGTLPAMSEVCLRRGDRLAPVVARLYAINTTGAAAGVLCAAFWMPSTLGLRTSYGVAIGCNLLLGVVAATLSARDEAPRSRQDARPPEPSRVIAPWLAAYALLGGGATLGLEVLWTRMFALVLNSSVYAFGAILIVFLLALAAGAALSGHLASRLQPELHLFGLLLGAGIAVGASPFLLHAVTGRLGSIPSEWGFAPYLTLVFATALAVLGPPAALAGAVLPALLRFAPEERPGELVGRIVGLNTAGGVVGSLAAGFVLLPRLGLWRSLSIIALLYLVLALFAVGARTAAARYLRPAVLVATVLLGTFLDPTHLVLVRAPAGENALRVWQTAHGIVAVTEDSAGRRIRLDNVYVLGGTEGQAEERLQADLPLALHGAPKRVFFLGLGTGITAARALAGPVEQVTAVELIPEVIEAARTYFAPDAGALFEDPRARVLAGDGRFELARSTSAWDVIVSDLFVPWHEGAASLYSREHFAQVRAHLAPGGVFAQWLPLFQLDRDGFDTVARTMLDVFDDVALWYADLRDGEPIAALVARRRSPPASSPGGDDAPRGAPMPSAAHFVGQLDRARPLFASARPNTDDHPVLEYRAPRAMAAVRSGEHAWLTGPELDRLIDDLRAVPPPGEAHPRPRP